MSFKRIILILVIAIQVSGCKLFPAKPESREYRPIPEAWLEECELPAAPLDNGGLSEAFVKAMQCGEQGNKDKACVRRLIETGESCAD